MYIYIYVYPLQNILPTAAFHLEIFPFELGFYLLAIFGVILDPLRIFKVIIVIPSTELQRAPPSFICLVSEL